MKIQLTAVFQQVPEGYIAFVEELPGANTQAATLEEARANLEEAVTLILAANRELARKILETRLSANRSAHCQAVDLIALKLAEILIFPFRKLPIQLIHFLSI